MYGIDKDGKNIGVEDNAERIAEGRKKLNEALGAIDAAIEIAKGIADTYGLHFHFVPENIGDYYGRGMENDYTGNTSEGEWYPSYWNSSSAFC